MSEQFELGGIVADLKADEEAKRVSARIAARADHRESMACCWEEWEGNQGIVVGTRIEVGSVCAKLETPMSVAGFVGDDGEDGTLSQMYAYCAPCYIAEVISPDEFIAVIDYPEHIKDTVPYCWEHNGIRLRLDILDVWPPVAILASKRPKPVLTCHDAKWRVGGVADETEHAGRIGVSLGYERAPFGDGEVSMVRLQFPEGDTAMFTPHQLFPELPDMTTYERQKAADRAHHAERVQWLSEPRPLYACGTPVAAVDVINWREESERCLADPTGMRGFNSVEV